MVQEAIFGFPEEVSESKPLLARDLLRPGKMLRRFAL
jgi:hypothetical protein